MKSDRVRSRSRNVAFRKFAIERFGTNANLIGNPAPPAFLWQGSIPRQPGVESGRDCLQRENFRMKPRSLDLVSEMTRPNLRECGVFFEAAA